MISNINCSILRERLISPFSRLKARFQFEVRKIFRIRLYISLDRQALSEYEITLMIPIFK